MRKQAAIGKPALELLDDDTADIYVLELSSFQLETCLSLQPTAAVVLNISDDHMDRHATFEEYARIKMSIYQNAQTSVCLRQSTLTPLKTNNFISFGLDVPNENDFGILKAESKRWLARGDMKIMPTEELSLLGAVGELNALAALSLAYPYIKDMPIVVKLLQQFSGLPYRCQLVSTKNNVHWINDSKGTNVGATVACLLYTSPSPRDS